MRWLSRKQARLGPGALAVAACVAGLLLAGPVLAQVNNAVVELRVADAGKLALPGVTAKLTNPATGLSRTMTTEADGGALFAALPPGTYTLRLDLEGFVAVVEENLALRVGQTLRVNAMMQQAQATEQVTVTAQAPLVDVVKTDSSTNIVPEQIQSLPVPDRDFQRLAFIAPGVERERGGYRFIGGGPVIGAGGNASQATIMVDGVDFTDPALGLARARISQDSIREFRVINNRFDTEIGGSAGGALSIVTRSGTNLLAGSVFAFYRADDLRSKGALETESLPYDRGQYGFTLGGPIIKDKTHFFLSAEYITEDNILLFRPGGAYASLAKDVKHPFKQTLGFGSIDHSFSDNQRLAAKLVFEQYREKNFRVGGVGSEAWGQELKRDNWNLAFEHTLVPSPSYLNELHVQVGKRKYTEPTNSTAVEEWFSSGNTLKTGTNTVGSLLGDGTEWEIRDTAHMYLDTHELKMGIGLQHIKERSDIPTFQNGTFVYLTDTRAIPISYIYGVGSASVPKSTDLYSAFIQDDWRPASNLTVNLGLRYDYDTDGNNPDFKHPLVPNGRKRDSNNYQPRLGFSWDVAGNGKNLIRGGIGRFIGRFLLVPAFTELQQNGITGRINYTRVNGVFYWPLCPALGITDPAVCHAIFPALDPSNPTTTGVPQKGAITLIDTTFVNPYADQLTLGWTTRLGGSNVFFDAEGIWVKGHDEIFIRDKNWTGNATHLRPNSTYTNINTYTNDGHSEYKALVFSLNGTLKGGHLLTASFTVSDKKNLSDDFSPEYTAGYPNDPADPEGEWGHGRGFERYRIVVSGVFRLPWDITIAPIAEYGSGQPWTRRRGYDYNGDAFNSDRAPGVKRNGQDGPPFRQLSLRLTKAFALAKAGRLEVLAEAFNVFNTVNYDVNSINAGEFLSGPTIANPTATYLPNPRFGKYSSTLPGREIQLGLRWTF
ncbi:MAG: hypothetical protein A2Y78_03970 [Acidobacteria bacterium RBG_13_68_16]|nr:MAG: hypothetical protein A2Y78_03970 [Acidobacteria bacterium RBG_13_68_16]